jgi:hypothetical protein
MKDEGGRMKGVAMLVESFNYGSHTFILHPSAFILSFVTERDHRINFRGLARGDIAGEQGDEDERQ